MSKKTTLFFLVLAALFSFVLALNTTTPLPSFNTSLIDPHRRISAIFAFGDSTLDTGNNDYIPTIFQGNHMPYGRDFHGYEGSGRFSNGRLAVDFLVSYLGLKNALPPYLDPTINDQDLLTGVSFASAGSGLDDLTATMANVMTMNSQLENFGSYLNRIQNVVGVDRANQIIRDAIFVISAGTNDIVFNFYDLPTRTLQFSLSSYQDFLLRRLESVVQRLYAMGARKFAISGLPPIGCLPIQMTIGSFIPGEHMFQHICVHQQNQDSQDYNYKLEVLIGQLQASLPGSIAAYYDVYSPLMDMTSNPSRLGFEVTTIGCCGSGMVEMGFMCAQFSPTCPDASRYMFWDAIHPTEAAYRALSSIFDQTVLPRFLL